MQSHAKKEFIDNTHSYPRKQQLHLLNAYFLVNNTQCPDVFSHIGEVRLMGEGTGQICRGDPLAPKGEFVDHRLRWEGGMQGEGHKGSSCTYCSGVLAIISLTCIFEVLDPFSVKSG